MWNPEGPRPPWAAPAGGWTPWPRWPVRWRLTLPPAPAPHPRSAFLPAHPAASRPPRNAIRQGARSSGPVTFSSVAPPRRPWSLWQA
eukprot:3004257-Alexandrium_andersonii.AAC.1